MTAAIDVRYIAALAIIKNEFNRQGGHAQKRLAATARFRDVALLAGLI